MPLRNRACGKHQRKLKKDAVSDKAKEPGSVLFLQSVMV